MASPELDHRPSEIGQQGELKLDIPIELKELSEQEFNKLAIHTLREFGKSVILGSYGPVRRGEQKEVVGGVSQRPGENEIVLEAGIEHTFVNTCQQNNLPVIIIGEHHDYISPGGNGHSRERKHVAFLDAVDNTKQYEHKPELPAPLYTVAGIYSIDGRSVAGIIGDLKNKKMYIAANGKNFLVDLETGEEKEVKPSQRTSIKDEGFCIATYLGEPQFTLSFTDNFSKVLKTMNQDGDVQPHSGSFAYGHMADGSFDIYLIKGEPESERLPGWVFAENAGFTAYEISLEDGIYAQLTSNVAIYKDNPEAYRKKRISIYLATRSPQIRDEIISLLVKEREEKRLQELRNLFVLSRPNEFEIFRASQAQQAPTN